MKKSKFTESQIAFVFNQAETGVNVEEICRKTGISEATFYNWKKKYGGLGILEFISKELNHWAWENKVTLDFSRPGKPTDNPFIESFNGAEPHRKQKMNIY